MTEILNILKDFDIFGVIALLGVIIFILVRRQKGQSRIANNHLHPLPDMADGLRRIETAIHDVSRQLDQANETLQYLKGRINGKSE